MPPTPERISLLEHRVSVMEKCLKIGLVVLIPGVGFWFWWVTSNLWTVKQNLKDVGSKDLVSAIQDPRSSQQLRADLSTVVAGVRQAEIAGTRPNLKKVTKLSEAVSEAVAKEPNLPEGWQAAAQLISYRSTATSSAEANDTPCQRASLRITDTVGAEGLGGTYEVSNCTLDLSAPEVWNLNAQKGSYFDLILHNVRVRYSGGGLEGIRSITFDHCLLDFDLNESPKTPAARNMTLQLLASSNFDNVRVTVSAG